MAGIIKVGQRASAAAVAASTAYQFDDMGQAYLDRVRGEAAKIIADARLEAVRLKAQAADEGKQAALKAVEASLRTRIDQQLQSLLAALGLAVQGIEQSRQAWQKHWEEQGIRLATAIASRLVRREIRHAPEIPLDLVREALQLAAGNQRIVVRMNPEDHTALGPQAELLASQLNQISRPEIVADPAITPGGCRVETEFGAIDQQFETQLARLTEELLS
ncbi:MAG: FliH/SctL family protein [Pirellulaceae bacterium]